MDGHDSDVMAGGPDGCQKITPIGAPGFRGVENVQKRGFWQKPPNLAKNGKIGKNGKNGHFRENPKNDPKNGVFSRVRKCIERGTNMR
jgi:hypothetical protein